MNFLNFILDDVKKYSEIVSKVINIDVEIMDSSFTRIAGTGTLKEKVGLNMKDESHIYHQVLKTKKTIIIFEPREDTHCFTCQKKDLCKEELEISTPIIYQDEVIGVIGLICFEKDKKYELHYEKKTYDADEKTEEIKLNVDPSSYTDQIEDSKKLASDYLNAVFLGGDAKSKDKAKSSKGKEDFVLGGDLEQDKNDFRAAFAEDFKRKLHDYPFTDKEVNAFIDAYVENNAKRSEISYTVAQYMPNEIVIKIKPRTVSLSKTILNYSKEFSDKHRSEYANLSEFYKAQDKNYADDMMAGLDSRPLLTPERDYQLKFVKTDGKWVLERDFSYESIVISFEGDIS